MLILSIPFLNSKFVRKNCADSSINWKEYRLDYLNSWSSFPVEILDQHSILTIREKSEGGIHSSKFNDKITFYKKAIKRSNCLADIEVQHYQANLINPENLILSYHDFSEKIDFSKLEKIIAIMNQLEARFVKIAVELNLYSELLELESFLSKLTKPVIFAGMGKLGRISRLLYKHLGAAGTFAGLDDNPTAIGQLTADEASHYNLKSISHKSKLGGIIGGYQIEHSLGLRFYNEYFKKNDLDAFYFPFVVEDPADFMTWQKKCSFEDRFYGFSITMPFKKEINPNRKPYNLFLPRKLKFHNTDRLAFKTALKYLKITPKNSILIYGNGGSAETLMNLLPDHEQLFVYARRKQNGSGLNQKYIELKNAKNKHFDLLVNCTPLGMKGESFRQLTGINKFKKVIDLPYGENTTDLIRYCQNNTLPCVDGQMFWRWQAEKQLEKFRDEMK